MENIRDLTNEIWKDIPGYEGMYQASNNGEIKSLKTNKILKNGISGFGYKNINLTVNGKHKSRYIHKLVVEAFIPNLENKPQVNHKDGNKLNNKVENLEWVTVGENNAHAYRIGLRSSPKGKNNYYSKTLMRKVKQYDLDGNFIKEWESLIQAARETGCCYQNIQKCLKGKRKHTHGYIWESA